MPFTFYYPGSDKLSFTLDLEKEVGSAVWKGLLQRWKDSVN